MKPDRILSRVENGHRWEWSKHLLMADHWRSTSGNCVRIFKPIAPSDPWIVANYKDSDTVSVSDMERTDVPGSNAEQRAFALAARLVHKERRNPSAA